MTVECRFLVRKYLGRGYERFQWLGPTISPVFFCYSLNIMYTNWCFKEPLFGREFAHKHIIYLSDTGIFWSHNVAKFSYILGSFCEWQIDGWTHWQHTSRLFLNNCFIIENTFQYILLTVFLFESFLLNK